MVDLLYTFKYILTIVLANFVIYLNIKCLVKYFSRYLTERCLISIYTTRILRNGQIQVYFEIQNKSDISQALFKIILSLLWILIR